MGYKREMKRYFLKGYKEAEFWRSNAQSDDKSQQYCMVFLKFAKMIDIKVFSQHNTHTHTNPVLSTISLNVVLICPSLFFGGGERVVYIQNHDQNDIAFHKPSYQYHFSQEPIVIFSKVSQLQWRELCKTLSVGGSFLSSNQ